MGQEDLAANKDINQDMNKLLDYGNHLEIGEVKYKLSSESESEIEDNDEPKKIFLG